MRIREIFEGKQSQQPPSSKESSSQMTKFPQMGNTYEIYRFGVAMASSPEITTDATHGPVGETPVVVAYSDGEEEIINSTMKQMNVRGNKITSKGSKETPGTNVTSPVSKPKRNRYGV